MVGGRSVVNGTARSSGVKIDAPLIAPVGLAGRSPTRAIVLTARRSHIGAVTTGEGVRWHSFDVMSVEPTSASKR